MNRIFAYACAVPLAFVFFVAPAYAQTGGIAELVNTIGLPLIAVLTPMLVAFFKTKIVPAIPTWLVPIVALIIGPLGELAVAQLTGAGWTGWQGALAGLAGVGVREIVDQIKKALIPA